MDQLFWRTLFCGGGRIVGYSSLTPKFPQNLDYFVLPVILPQHTKTPFNGFEKLSMSALAILRQVT